MRLASRCPYPSNTAVMDPTFWNDRYAQNEASYGVHPNRFIEGSLPKHVQAPSDVLELATGTGRNAVWAAQQGYNVTALDYSETGLRLAEKEAKRTGAPIETICADVSSWRTDRAWDAVAVSYLHLPPALHDSLFSTIMHALRPGGFLVGEWFAPDQMRLGYESGGPRAIDFLLEADQYREFLVGGRFLTLRQERVQLEEGTFHVGLAAVIRVVWQKG